MINYKIIQNKLTDRPVISFEGVFSIMNEINSCDEHYLINDVMPNLEKVKNDISSSYEFGYTAVMIDFYKDKSIINDSWDDNFEKIEVSSEEVYQFMKEWTDRLVEWGKSGKLI